MSLIVDPKPEPTSLDKHLATLRRLSDRRERMAYIVAVCDSEGEGPAADLHMAYLHGWTEDQAKAARAAAEVPAKGRV